MTFEHRIDLEDYWANAANSFEVRKRFWSRIPLSLVRATEVFRVVDQVEDSRMVLLSGGTILSQR